MRMWHWQEMFLELESHEVMALGCEVECKSAVASVDSEISRLQSWSHGPCLQILTPVRFVMMGVALVDFFVLLKFSIICFYTVSQSLHLHSRPWKVEFLTS